MGILSFKEYLDSKGKTVEKPKIDPLANTGPDGDKAPEPFATEGKGWKDKAAVKEKPSPYAAPWKDRGQQKYEKGFGDEGDSKLKQEFKPADLEFDKDRKVDSWPKGAGLKSEALLRKVIRLPIHEFSAFLRESEDIHLPEVYAEKKGMVQPDPVQAVRYVTALAALNDSILEHLVREVNRTGFLSRLVASAFRHPDAYNTVGVLFQQSQLFQNRLADAIDEATDVPMEDEEDPDEEEQDENPDGKKNKNDGKMDDKGNMPDQNANMGDGPDGAQTSPEGGGMGVPGQPGTPGGSPGPAPEGPGGYKAGNVGGMMRAR